MAYNRRYNPDALPAHVEPEQAAAMLSSKTQRGPSGNDPPYRLLPPQPSTASTRPPQQDELPIRHRPVDPPRRQGSGNYDSYTDNRRVPVNTRVDTSSRQDEAGRGSRNSSYGSRYEEAQRHDDRPGNEYTGGRPPLPQTHGNSRPPPVSTGSEERARDRDALWPMFRDVDKAGTGQLREQELGAALVNSDYSTFDPHTVKMMIRMFDIDRSGTISFDEFRGLWGFLTEWRLLFDRFDIDHSGYIDLSEFSSALVAFGYRLSQEYVSLLFGTYDIRGRGMLSFDLFVQSCIDLKTRTNVFKRYDTDRDGFITLSLIIEAKMKNLERWGNSPDWKGAKLHRRATRANSSRTTMQDG